jgi:hypothetical protein
MRAADVFAAVLVAVISVVGGAVATLLSGRSRISERQVLPGTA